MDIVVGTYEQLLLGFRVLIDEGHGNKYTFTQSFTDHNHIGCIKSIAISRKGVLASGSTDESIQLLNLRKRIEMGSLVHHQGAITDLSFFQSSHLFSVSEDACLCIWSTSSWECLRTLKGHKAAITGLSVHPSGKLALTVGKDKTLRTWNLVTGRPAYITNTPQVGECIRWSPKGDYYAVLYPRSIHVYETETAGVHCMIEAQAAINAMVFCKDSVLAYSTEGGVISLHDVISRKEVHVINNNTKRVKTLVCDKCPDDSTVTWLVAASSNGVIKIWQLNFQDVEMTRVVAEVDTGFRIVCMAAVCHALQVAPKRQLEQSEDEESEEWDEERESDWSDEDDEVINVERTKPSSQSGDSTEQVSLEIKPTNVVKEETAKKKENNKEKERDLKQKASTTKEKRKKSTEKIPKFRATTKFVVSEQRAVKLKKLK